MYTNIVDGTLNVNILKRHHAGVDGRVLGRLELGRYNRRSSAIKFGELKGSDDELRVEGRGTSDTYCDSASTLARRFWIRDRAGPTLSRSFLWFWV